MYCKIFISALVFLEESKIFKVLFLYEYKHIERFSNLHYSTFKTVNLFKLNFFFMKDLKSKKKKLPLTLFCYLSREIWLIITY